MKGSIAIPNWEACETCEYEGNNGGCDKMGNSFSLHRLGDWIICDEYEEKEQPEPD